MPLQAGRRSSRSSPSPGMGWPRSLSDSSTTRAGSLTARPRSRPSTKSASRRARPEYGERRYEKRSRRLPPSQAKRSSPRSALPKAVRRSETRPSYEYGTPERSESRLEGRADAVEGRNDDGDLVRGHSAPDQRQDLLARELERRRVPRRPRGSAPRPRSGAGRRAVPRRASARGGQARGSSYHSCAESDSTVAGEAREIVRGALK